MATTASLPATETTDWKRRARRRRAVFAVLRPIFLPLLSLLVAAVVWQILSMTAFNPLLVPPPLEVARTAIPMLRSGEILGSAGISLFRIAVGFVSGSALAILVGVLMGRVRWFSDMFDPIIEVLRYLSPTAMIPIAIIWFGIGEMSKYFLIFWGTFFFVLINTVAGVIRIPLARQRAAQCMGASNLQIFLRVVIPSAVPYIITGMRVAMASAFMAIIPAEMLAADSGLGYLLETIRRADADQPHLRGPRHDQPARLRHRPSVSMAGRSHHVTVSDEAEVLTGKKASGSFLKKRTKKLQYKPLPLMSREIQEKFFASFFQKRSSFLLMPMPPPESPPA